MLNYFWYHRPDENFPPPNVTRPDEAGTSDRLAVVCTQTPLRPADQRKLVQHWCQHLPGLVDIRYLWLNSRVPQQLFDSVCRMPSLEGLFVKWSGVNNVDGLQKMRSLRYFHLGSSTGLRSIEPLAQLRDLKWLGLENLKQVRDFDPVGELTELEGLAIEGSIWTTQRVRSLAPVSKLRKLRYLSLLNLRADDKTLAPLFSLQTLETFCAEWRWWNQRELEEIRRRNPNLVTESDASSESGGL
jgi:hypothetical protein